MSFLTRTNGIVLLLALLCTHLCVIYKALFPRSKLSTSLFKHLQANPNILAHLTPYVVFGLGLLVVARVLSLGGEGHGDVLLARISLFSIARNLLYYASIFGDFFSLPGILPRTFYENLGFFAANPLGILVLLCFAYPIVLGVRIFWRSPYAAFIYLFILGSLAMLILWPATQGLRFCFNLLPFVAFLVSLGLSHLTKSRYTKFVRILSLAILVFFALKTTAYIARDFLNHHSPDSKTWEAYSSDAKDMYAYIQAHTDPNAIIVFFKPRVLYLQTGRLSIALREPETFIQRLESKGFEIGGAPHHIAYILAFSEEYTLEHGLSQEYLDALQDFGAIRIAHQNSKFTLYALDSDKALAMPYPQGNTHD